MGAHRAVRQAPILVFIEPLLFPVGQSQQLLLAGTNLENLLDSVDKDLAVANVTGVHTLNHVHHFLIRDVAHHDLNLHLGQQARVDLDATK